MLKRSRPHSPIPDSPMVQEPAFDLPERFTKRRRHLGPATPAQEGPSGIEPDDDETWLEDEGRPEYTRGRASWQEQAGLYKTANTLLHDLHAEQRHRGLFSPSTSLPTTPFSQLNLSSPSDTDSSSQWTVERSKSPSFLNQFPIIPASRHQFLKTVLEDQDQPDGDDTQFLENAETQMVADRYQNTNKLLGSVFLSRRRMLSTQEELHEQT